MTKKKLTTKKIRELLAKRRTSWECDGFKPGDGCDECPYQLMNADNDLGFDCGFTVVRIRAKAGYSEEFILASDLEALEAMRQYWKEHVL